jgi:hypothetical protein
MISHSQPRNVTTTNGHNENRHLLERCLQKAALFVGKGWDLEILEAIVENYQIDFTDQSEQTLYKIEIALRDILGSAANIFVDKFYLELKRAGYAYTHKSMY